MMTIRMKKKKMTITKIDILKKKLQDLLNQKRFHTMGFSNDEACYYDGQISGLESALELLIEVSEEKEETSNATNPPLDH